MGQWAFRGESWLGNGEYSSVILCHSAPLDCHGCDNHEQSRYYDEKTLKLSTSVAQEKFDLQVNQTELYLF